MLSPLSNIVRSQLYGGPLDGEVIHHEVTDAVVGKAFFHEVRLGDVTYVYQSLPWGGSASESMRLVFAFSEVTDRMKFYEVHQNG